MTRRLVGDLRLPLFPEDPEVRCWVDEALGLDPESGRGHALAPGPVDRRGPARCSSEPRSARARLREPGRQR
jgi:hypothetical protein